MIEVLCTYFFAHVSAMLGPRRYLMMTGCGSLLSEKQMNTEEQLMLLVVGLLQLNTHLEKLTDSTCLSYSTKLGHFKYNFHFRHYRFFFFLIYF